MIYQTHLWPNLYQVTPIFTTCITSFVPGMGTCKGPNSSVSAELEYPAFVKVNGKRSVFISNPARTGSSQLKGSSSQMGTLFLIQKDHFIRCLLNQDWPLLKFYFCNGFHRQQHLPSWDNHCTWCLDCCILNLQPFVILTDSRVLDVKRAEDDDEQDHQDAQQDWGGHSPCPD